VSKEFSENDIKKIIANPFYTININPNLSVEHEPLIDKAMWVDAAWQSVSVDDSGKKYDSIEEIEDAFKKWADTLLCVLEGNFV
jgi:hypothetical protein